MAVTEVPPAVERRWARERVDAWLADPAGEPVMLLHGPPGSGKSWLVAAICEDVATRSGVRLAAALLRAGHRRDPYRAGTLAAGLLGALRPADIPVAGEAIGPRFQATVHQEVIGGNAVGVVLHLPAGEETAEALARVAQAGDGPTVLVVVDAVDQAEDEGADELLRFVAHLVAAAEGTRVRLLCSSRQARSPWLDSTRTRSLDVEADAPDLDGELRDYAAAALAGRADADSLVPTLVGRADGNWLWLTTNVDWLVARPDEAPPSLTRGLAGLYEDGLRRIRAQLGAPAFRGTGRRVLGSVACAFGGAVPLRELVAVVGADRAEVETVVTTCHPFLRQDLDEVRLFHPAFGRWLLSGGLEGTSEAAQHLVMARALTAYGTAQQWRHHVVPYAADWTLQHWVNGLLLDPFTPDRSGAQDAVVGLLEDRRWVREARWTMTTLRHLADVAPHTPCPGRPEQVVGVLHSLVRSVTARRLLSVVSSVTDAADVDREVAEARVLVECVLSGWVDLTASGGWTLTAPGVLAVAAGRPPFVADTVSAELLVELLEPTEAGALAEAAQVDPALDAADRAALQGYALRALGGAAEDEDAAADLAHRSVEAFTSAWRAAPAGSAQRAECAIDLADGIARLRRRQPDQVRLRVEAQREILQARRAAEHPERPKAAWILGRALDALVALDDEDPAADDLRREAAAAYAEAWDVTDPDEDEGVVLDRAIGLADALIALPSRTPEQTERWVQAQASIQQIRKGRGDEHWVVATSLLARAVEEWAAAGAEDERPTRLRQAAMLRVEAWAATPADDDERAERAVLAANALLGLADRDLVEQRLLVAVAREVTTGDIERDDPRWRWSVSVLADTLDDLQGRVGPAEREAVRRELVETLRTAWVRTPPDDEVRLDLAIRLADALYVLTEPTADERMLRVDAQREVCRLSPPDADLRAQSTALLADALWSSLPVVQADELHERRKEAVDTFRLAWTLTPVDGPRRADRALRYVNASGSAADPDVQECRHRLAAQREVVAATPADSEDLAVRLAVLGTCLLDLAGLVEKTEEDAETQEGEERPDDEAGDEPGPQPGARRAEAGGLHAEAVEVLTRCLESTPPEHERWASRAAALCDALRALPDPSAATAATLVDVQRLLAQARRQAGDARWWLSWNLLGDALLALAAAVADEPERAGDLGLQAIDAYRVGWEHAPAQDQLWVRVSMDLVNALLARSVREPEQVRLLIEVASAVRARATGDPEVFGQAATVLGFAFDEAAALASQERRDALLRRAADACGQALAVTPPDDERREDRLVSFANALIRIRRTTEEEAEAWVQAQTELVALRPDDTLATELLGDAWTRLAQAGSDLRRGGHLVAAADAYAHAATLSTEQDGRLRACLVGEANVLLELGVRTLAQTRRLVDVGRRIVAVGQAEGAAAWWRDAGILDDAVQELAYQVDDEEREALLAESEQTLAAAWAAVPADDEGRLALTVRYANARVLARVWVGDPLGPVLDECAALVEGAAGGQAAAPQLQDLVPVLAMRLHRRRSER